MVRVGGGKGVQKYKWALRKGKVKGQGDGYRWTGWRNETDRRVMDWRKDAFLG